MTPQNQFFLDNFFKKKLWIFQMFYKVISTAKTHNFAECYTALSELHKKFMKFSWKKKIAQLPMEVS